jgi:hypothetical protein
MALVFRTFKAASSGARFTPAKTVARTVARVLERVPSPTFESFRAAFLSRAPREDREARLTTNMSAPSTIGPRPTYPTTQAAPAAPDMAAAMRAARKEK